MEECEKRGHRFDWALTLPHVPLDNGQKLRVNYVGCERCKTAVATPETDLSTIGEKGAEYINSMLARMGATPRGWQDDKKSH